MLLHLVQLTGDSFETMLKRGVMPKLLHTVPFGKYKGKPFTAVPPSYRQWLLGQDNLDPDTRYTLQKLQGI